MGGHKLFIFFGLPLSIFKIVVKIKVFFYYLGKSLTKLFK